MTNYYVEKDGKIIFVDTDLEKLQTTLQLVPNSDQLEIKQTTNIINESEGQFIMA